jgi:hypothetical protein
LFSRVHIEISHREKLQGVASREIASAKESIYKQTRAKVSIDLKSR